MTVVYPNMMLHPTFLDAVIQERPDKESIKQSYIGTSLLPYREVPERRLTWDSQVAENNLAGIYAAKGKAVPGDDVMFSSHFANLVDVKASRRLDPDIVGKIRDPGMPAVYAAGGSSWVVKGIADRIQRHVSEYLAWCDDTVEATIEYFVFQALLGSLVWPPKDNDGNAIASPMPHWNADESLSISFPVNANFVQDATTLTGHKSRAGTRVAWNAAGADIVTDLEVIAEYMVEQKGINVDEATVLMSRSTLSHVALATKTLDWIRGEAGESPSGSRMVTVATLKDFIKTKLGFNIQTYDAQWTYRAHAANTRPTISYVKFLKEGNVLILPKGIKIGTMAHSPHEDQSGAFRAGKIPYVYREPIPPYEREMGISDVAWPILTTADCHFILSSYD